MKIAAFRTKKAHFLPCFGATFCMKMLILRTASQEKILTPARGENQ